MEIKGLQEKLGVTDEQFDRLRELRVAAELRTAQLYTNVWRRGGTLHNSGDPVEKAKRRKANKVASKQRKANRG